VPGHQPRIGAGAHGRRARLFGPRRRAARLPQTLVSCPGGDLRSGVRQPRLVFLFLPEIERRCRATLEWLHFRR